MKVTFLSMAKIKDHHSVPQYLMDKMCDIVWDGWVGDQSDGTKCTKFACKYTVGRVHFYFIFSRGPYTNSGESPSGENYLFRALAAHRIEDTKWFAKRYQPSDFNQVILTVSHYDDNAISQLELEETTERNPLNFT